MVRRKRELDFNEFDRILYYDKSSPSCLKWKVDRYRKASHKKPFIRAGDDAGTLHPQGYWRVAVGAKQYPVHRIICLLDGRLKCCSSEVDHINRVRSDNRSENLRVVSATANQRNKGSLSNNTSGVRGVSLQGHKTGNLQWIAKWVSENGKQKAKCFSVRKYGYEKAFDLAVLARAEAIDKLNENGGGYIL